MPYTLQQFGQEVKKKFPNLANVSDEVAAQSVLKRYPEYQSWVQGSARQSDFPEMVDPQLGGTNASNFNTSSSFGDIAPKQRPVSEFKTSSAFSDGSDQPTDVFDPKNTYGGILTNNPVTRAVHGVGRALVTGLDDAAGKVSRFLNIGASEAPQLKKSVEEAGTQTLDLQQRAYQYPVGDPRRTQLLQESNRTSEASKAAISDVESRLPTNTEFVGAAETLGLTAYTAVAGLLNPATPIKTVGVPFWDFAKQALLRAANNTGPVGGAFTGAAAAQNNGTPAQIARASLYGYLVSGAGSLAMSGAKYVLTNTIPTYLANKKGVPELAQQEYNANPVAGEKGKNMTDAKLVEEGRKLTKVARKQLTAQWEAGEQKLIDTNTGKRFGLDNKAQVVLKKVATAYPEVGDAMPQNVSKVSLLETLDLNKALNANIPKLGTPEYAQWSYAKGSLLEAAGKAFGPEMKLFLQDYGVQAQMLNNLNLMFRTAKAGQVGADQTARTLMHNLFNENKGAYYDALKAAAMKFGFPELVPQIAGFQYQQGVNASALTNSFEIALQKVQNPTVAGWIKSAFDAMLDPILSTASKVGTSIANSAFPESAKGVVGGAVGRGVEKYTR